MEAAFKLGPFTVGWYGIIIALAAMAAIAITLLEAKRREEDTDHVLNIAIITIPLGIIGARLYHVIDLWDFYRPVQDISRALVINDIGTDEAAAALIQFMKKGESQCGF